MTCLVQIGYSRSILETNLSLDCWLMDWSQPPWQTKSEHLGLNESENLVFGVRPWSTRVLPVFFTSELRFQSRAWAHADDWHSRKPSTCPLHASIHVDEHGVCSKWQRTELAHPTNANLVNAPNSILPRNIYIGHIISLYLPLSLALL